MEGNLFKSGDLLDESCLASLLAAMQLFHQPQQVKPVSGVQQSSNKGKNEDGYSNFPVAVFVLIHVFHVNSPCS